MKCRLSKRATMALTLFTTIAGPAPLALAQPVVSAVDSNAVLGFETTAGWSVTGNAARTPTEASTTTRTQRDYALALNTPSTLTKVISMPVSSTATALAGVGNAGAILEVDVMLPTLLANPNNSGQLSLLLNSRSLRINQVNIGSVNFNAFRAGIYNTMKFPIPSAVGTALGSAAFNDLTFQFLVSSPGIGVGTYLFDNLRVHSPPALVTGDKLPKPPAGYGGSVDFVVIGGTPEAQLFVAGPLQVPDSFHLKLGTAGSTTVQLDIGYDGTPAFTCTYGADSTDASGKSYKLITCTDGFQPGDLVGASWARLNIVGGDSSMKIRAQLARNPVGDTIGGGIIPPMPTWWGDFDSCIPAPVAGQVVTESATCAAQTAEANQILTAYFNKLSVAQFPPNWVVTPTPELALRHGSRAPYNTSDGPPPPNDPPFNQEAHINRGGDFDAYWRIFGNMGNTQSGNQNTTTLTGDLGTHVVLFGNDIDVLGASAEIDSVQSTTTSSVSANAQGTLNLFFLGSQVSSTTVTASANGSTGSAVINFHPDYPQTYNAPEIPIWIFVIQFGVTLDVGLDLTGNFAPGGVNVTVSPHGSAGAHVFGGIDLGFASGGIDAQVELISAAIPITASASWLIDTRPTACAITPSFTLQGNATISSGGGQLDIVGSLGYCPFCVDASWPLLSWDGITDSFTLFGPYNIGIPAIPLPTLLCTAPLSVSITPPSTGTSLFSGIDYQFTGSAASTNGGGLVPCSDLTWSLDTTVKGETLTPQTTGYPPCSVTVNLTQLGARTVKLHAAISYNSLAGPIPETGDATLPINVTSLPDGVYITDIFGPARGQPNAFPTCLPGSGSCAAVQIVNPPTSGSYILEGQSVGATAPICTTWTVAPADPITLMPTGLSTTLSSDGLIYVFPNSEVLWTPTTVSNGAFYAVTMSTTNAACGSGGTTYGTTTAYVMFVVNQ